MNLQRGAIPLYYQIAQILRGQIHSHEYKVGDMLPTEEEVMRTFRVSRTTVRQAFQVLLTEALIYRIAGKGTFVSSGSPTRHGDFSVRSIEEIIAAGYVTKLKFLGCKTVRVNGRLAKSLQAPPGAEVTQFRGVRYVGDEPFFHLTLHVPTDLAAKIPLDRIEEEPVSALIEKYCGFQIQEISQWIAASLAGSEIGRHLKLKPGDPVLLVERHFIDATGRVVEIALDRYRTDHMRLFLRLTRPGPAGVVLGNRSEVG